MKRTGRMKPCLNCGAEFYITPCHDVGGTSPEKKFCGSVCVNAYRKRPEVVEARFWERVDKRGPDECWPYLGSITSKHGYGCSAFHGRVLGAHRVAWMLTKGAIPDGLAVLHKCDNRICCNTAHHFLGTWKDNSDDKIKKGRYRHRYSPKETLLFPQYSRRRDDQA